MASRPVWKGFIRFSLVSVPVRAYTAGVSGEGGKIRFNQLHKDCNQRVKYQKVCPTHGELKSDEIVKGYEFADNQYVIVDDAELDTVRTARDKSLDIQGFIPPDAIDARYYTDKHYFLTPDGPVAQKPYTLLLRAMAEQNRFAFAQVVFGNREQIVVLRPAGRLLMMDMIQYAERVKTPAEFEAEVVTTDVAPAELKLAKTLTEQLADDDFRLDAYKDLYEERMAKLVEAKVEGKDVVAAPEEEAPQVINLMEALQRSVEQAKQAATSRGKPPRLSAPGTAEKAAHSRKRKTS